MSVLNHILLISTIAELRHLFRDLTEMGPQNPALKNKIIYDNGSVHNLSEIPVAVKLIYKDERNLTLHRPVLKLKYTHR
ncbi:unnamed protein product [Trifolium pratense]|uniref:Uncharacterized protein n=1 Tax=Trifolium pratense TaxID=57577 RepID=A0ACB0JVD6_TRIPR|nr:unnamed protein product [Trifolium pratense]